MTVKRFASKIDAWLLAVLALAVLLQIVATVGVLMQNEDPWAGVIMVLVSLLLFVLIGTTVAFTYYSVEGNTLRVVSGPFRWTIPIDRIESVEPTRNPLSAPALSIDRLKIRYSGGKAILVSPADKKGFVRALGVEQIEKP